MLEAEAVAAQAAVVAANRERLRMDAPAVDPTLLRGAQAVFVRGRGWFYAKGVSRVSVSVEGAYGTLLVPVNQIVDYR